MTWAARRKLIYFGIFFTIVVLTIGIPAFIKLYKKPTCFDNKQNQREQGIDCGGTCVQLCKHIQLQPVVRWQQLFKVTEGVYTATAYISNGNLDAEAIKVPYTFTIYDSQNQVIGTRKGITYIPPGKNFAIVETGIPLSNAVPVRTLFEFGDNFIWRQAAPNQPTVTVEDQVWSNVAVSPLITANLTNPTFTDIAKVNVAIIIYDSEKNAFAASRTVVDNLTRQSQQQIVFTWPEPFSKAISSIEIIPIPQ